jgi:hypothetical protein
MIFTNEKCCYLLYLLEPAQKLLYSLRNLLTTSGLPAPSHYIASYSTQGDAEYLFQPGFSGIDSHRISFF